MTYMEFYDQDGQHLGLGVRPDATASLCLTGAVASGEFFDLRNVLEVDRLIAALKFTKKAMVALDNQLAAARWKEMHDRR